MKRIFDNGVKLLCTDNDKEVTASIDNFKEGKSFNVYLATNKIHMKWNGRVYVGNAHGMEFTSKGPEYYDVPLTRGGRR